MVIVVKGTRKNPQVQELIDWIEQRNISVQATEGTQKTILGLVGDTSVLDIDTVKTFPVVEDVKRIQEPYKRANRKFHREDTVVEAGGVRLGGGNFQVIAGPCSVESEEQMCGIAREVQAAGARLLRGGAFKPRTSPYAFQGLKAEGIEYLTEAGQLCKMPIVTEIMSASDLELFHDVDIIQVGWRLAGRGQRGARRGDAQIYPIGRAARRCDGRQPDVYKRQMVPSLSTLSTVIEPMSVVSRSEVVTFSSLPLSSMRK